MKALPPGRVIRSAVLAAIVALALPSAPLAGALAIEPPVLLAETYRDSVDPAAYWVSEKLDGVRAVWDGQRLRFRSGAVIPAPGWFLAALPAEPLDGELWMGRGNFDRLSGIVRSQQPDDEAWRQVRYMMFELPGAPGSFTERITRMKALVATANVSWFAAVPQFRVADRQALRRRLGEVVGAGGEGLMLHRADARWIAGRSDVLLKLKPWLDAEARVVGHIGGRGKYEGMLGALEVETSEGVRFRLGTGFTDEMRRNPPPIGAVVTYRYRELTPKGKPRFASYWRQRELP